MQIISKFSQPLLSSADSDSEQGVSSIKQNKINGSYTPPSTVAPKITSVEHQASIRRSLVSHNKENQVPNFASPSSKGASSLNDQGARHRFITSGDAGTSLLKEQFGNGQKKTWLSDEQFNEESIRMARKAANERNVQAGRPPEYDLDYHPPVYDQSKGSVSPAPLKKLL